MKINITREAEPQNDVEKFLARMFIFLSLIYYVGFYCLSLLLQSMVCPGTG